MRFLLPIILILAAIGLYFGYTDPVLKEIKDLQARVAEFDEALSNSKQLQATKSELTRRFNQFSPQDLDKLEKLLPDSADNINFIIQIERIASQNTMQQPTNITFAREEAEAPAEAARDYNVFDVEFSTTGKYENFVGFLKDLERNLRVTDVTFVSFSAEQERGRRGIPTPTDIYEYDMKVRTYYLR